MLEIFYKLKLLINVGLNYAVGGIKGKRLCIISKDIQLRCNCFSLLSAYEGSLVNLELNSVFSPSAEESAEGHTLSSF